MSTSTSDSRPAAVVERLPKKRPRIYQQFRPRRIVGGVLERTVGNPTKQDDERIPLWKKSENILRSYIKHHLLPQSNESGFSPSRHHNEAHCREVDPEDFLAYLAILVETKLLDPNDLASIELQPFVHPYCRSNRISVWHRRITRIRLGYSGCASWDFCTAHVWDLLGHLDHLDTLHVEGCADFQLFETIRRLPKLKVLHVECQTSYGFHANPPRRLVEETSHQKKPPPHPLESLCLPSCTDVTEDDLAKWLLDVVLPSFPNMQTLRIQSNQIDSFQRIALRLQQDDSLKTMGRKHSLQTLDLGRWVPKSERPPPPRRRKRPRHSTEGHLSPSSLPTAMEAMQVLFTSLSQLRTMRGCADTLMEYVCVARALKESQRYPLPLNLWPTVLETAWKRGFCFVQPWESFRMDLAKPSPAGIYHMLNFVLSEKEKRLFETNGQNLTYSWSPILNLVYKS